MNYSMTPVIWIHLIAALAALGLGTTVFLFRKGNEQHRWIGRAWAVLILVVAISSFWIRSSGNFSWIHGLSVLVLVILAGGVYFAVTHRVRAHRRTMTGLFFGSLVVTGMFTLMPHRLLGHLLWTSLGMISS